MLTETGSACIIPYRELPTENAAHPTRLCVIDLGTNSFHSLIVDAYPNGAYTILDRLKDVVRLGDHGLLTGQITKKGIERSIRALQRVKLLAQGWGVTEYLAYATSAIREARNGGDFIIHARERTGIKIRVIDGDLEAHLIYQGVRRAVEMRVPTLVVDIGGGSTEFIVGTSDEVIYRKSLKLGAARMAGRFLTTDPVDREEFVRLRRHYRDELKEVFEAARDYGVREIVGSSGTTENLAQVYLNHFGDPSLNIYQQPFAAPEFRQVTKLIMTSTRRDRMEMNGIDRKRVDQVVAGAMLADVVLKDLDVERIRISSHALREGMVEDYIERNRKRLRRIAPFTDVRRRSVHEIGFRYRWDRRHVHHVAAIVLQLFDVCRPVHGLGMRERELLEYAALLHDIGYHISRSSHHKHSKYLIMQSDWQGFVPDEIEIMAHLARYHRGAPPRETHTQFQRLKPEIKNVIMKLAPLLRIAEGLERSRYQIVTGIRAWLTPAALNLVVETRSDPQLELWGAKRSAGMFNQVYERKLRVAAANGQPEGAGVAEAASAGHPA